LLHYRVEGAQLSPEEDGALLVTVQYQADTGTLLQIPRSMQDGARLLEPLQRLSSVSSVLCHADFAYESSPTLQTIPALPIRPPEDERHPVYDEIFGVRGVRHEFAGDETSGYTFALDRLPSGDIELALDFVLAAKPPAEMPRQALDMATSFTRFLVAEKQTLR
jgi:hypothetical protein